MSFSKFDGAAIGGLETARSATLDPSPGRLHRIRTFGRELGRMGTPADDALEEIENALWADGLLPIDRPSQARAWRLTIDAARDAFAEGAGECVAAMAPAALADANGDPIAAVRVLMERALLFADDSDVADALCLVWADKFIAAVRKAVATGEAEWIERADAEEAALRFELSRWAELKAERAADAIFAALPDDGDFVAALIAIHPLITREIASEVAGRTLARYCAPPVRRLEFGPNIQTNPFDTYWGEPDKIALALHEKARAMSQGHQVPSGFNLQGAMLDLEMRAQEVGTPEGLALAAAMKRERLGMNAPFEADEPESEPLTTDDRLIDLCSPPGLVGEIVDWMEASSDRPNRVLLLGAALTFVGTLAGRKFATPSNLRTNNLVVTLAPSGHGKDHALGRVKTLASAAGLDRYVGPARIMSASALRKLVAREPAVGCYMDEFGGFMGQIHDRRAGLHNAMIRYDLLEMFSAAGTFFAGAEYAGEAATKVFAPNFSISGTSTPESFWSSLSSLSASDGLLARLILLDVTGPKPARVKPRLSPNDVPAALVDAVRALAEQGGNLASISSDRAPRPSPCRWTIMPRQSTRNALLSWTEPKPQPVPKRCRS